MVLGCPHRRGRRGPARPEIFGQAGRAAHDRGGRVRLEPRYGDDAPENEATEGPVSADRITWTAPKKIYEEGQWLWRVSWHEGKAYGISYSYDRARHPDPKVAEAAEADGPVPPGPYDWKPRLITSTDGVNWELVTQLDIPGRPNEATVRIRSNGEMIALVRRERGTYNGWIGVSQPPYLEWSWHEGEWWVSYYSSHEDKDGNPPPNRHTALRTAIYIARVKLE